MEEHGVVERPGGVHMSPSGMSNKCGTAESHPATCHIVKPSVEHVAGGEHAGAMKNGGVGTPR